MQSTQAICPACKEEVAFLPTANGQLCPKCGVTFGGDTAARTPPALLSPAQTTQTWPVLLGVLLAPSVITFLAALARNDAASAGIALLGSGVAALFGAFWLASRLKLHVGVRIGLGILLAPVFYLACLALCFAGCAVGGGAKFGG